MASVHLACNVHNASLLLSVNSRCGAGLSPGREMAAFEAHLARDPDWQCLYGQAQHASLEPLVQCGDVHCSADATVPLQHTVSAAQWKAALLMKVRFDGMFVCANKRTPCLLSCQGCICHFSA
jgi:hypothetical protein